jgi:hypothetical protein
VKVIIRSPSLLFLVLTIVFKMPVSKVKVKAD